ncbi:glycosyl/arabinosyl/mannosyl transferase [Acetobacter musti]|uniref:Glycosyl/arabinosyl/mannosyl transferase n=1 Tax=Acetobacter musti TaxID=864732 RepID=A0ABX0JL41_9PROT|nr:glycosyl/arabinosyl/mannosyl transferase [Acetobacter musti]
MTGSRSAYPAPSVCLAVSALAGVTLLRLLAAAYLPVTPDEAYYWTWSRHLQASYLDHPPMVALWIRAGTILFGNTGFGIRVTGPLAAAAGTLLIAAATRDFMTARSTADRCATDDVTPPVIAGLLLNATLALGLGAVMMTPDTPLLFFMALFLAALGRLAATGNGRWWLLLGMAAGLGFDSKYTMLLPAAGIGVWCLLTRPGRAWLKTPWPWAALLLSGILTTPVLWWNDTHGWASFIRQGGRAGDWKPARAAQFLGELTGGQIGLLTPGIFLLCVIAFRKALRSHEATDRLLLTVTGIPLLVFFQHALGDRVQANWPVLIYPPLVVLTALSRPRWWRPAAILGFTLGALVLFQAITGVLPLSRHLDITLRQGGGWPAFARAVRARTQNAAFIASDDYGLASELAFRLKGIPVLGAEPRWQLFDLPGFRCTAGQGILIRNARRDFPAGSLWPSLVSPVTEIPRTRHGREAERYVLYTVRCPLLQDMRQLPAIR